MLRGQNFNGAALQVGGPTLFATPAITSSDPAYLPDVYNAISNANSPPNPSYQVQCDDGGAPCRRKRVTVQVAWVDPFGHTRTKATNALTTLITDPNP